MSAAEEMLALHLKADKICYQREVQEIIPGRKFKFDFWCAKFRFPVIMDGFRASLDAKNYDYKQVLVEVQGGVWLKGKSGHSSGTGITRDCEKLSLAAVYGYRTIVVTPAQIKSGQAISWIKAALA
jgi:hypothetical protein